MDERRFCRVLDQRKPSPEQKKAMLDRLLQEERKVKPMRNLKKLTIIAVAAALMVTACAAAAVVTGLDGRLIEYLGAGPEDVELLAPSAVAVQQSHTYENGWTVEISQVLADRWSVAVLADITAPEDTVLDQESRIMLGLSQLDTQGERLEGTMTCHWAQLEDEDCADNRITVLWQFRRVREGEHVPFPGTTVKVTPLYVAQGRENWVQFKDSQDSRRWSCTVDLPEYDPGVAYPMDQSLEIGNAQVRLTGIYLSPLSLTVYVEDKEHLLRAPEWENPEEHQEEWETYWALQQLAWEDNVFLNLKDGTRLAATESQGKATGVSYTVRFDQILDPQEAASVTLFGQTFPLN